MPEFLHLQKIGKKLQSTAWSSQILQHLEQFLKNWFLHSKLSNSTSTPALLFYKSTTFFSPNSTFYNFFLWKFYIYKHPKFLQFYNIFLAIFYILQWFFGPNLQSTFTPPSPLLRDLSGDLTPSTGERWRWLTVTGNDILESSSTTSWLARPS